MQAGLKARADEDLALMSSKDRDECGAGQPARSGWRRKSRPSAPPSARSLPMRTATTGELTETARTLSSIAQAAGQQSIETASSAEETSVNVQTVVDRRGPARRVGAGHQGHNFTKPPASCGAHQAWLTKPTRPWERSHARRSISMKWWASSATSPARPTCWRSTPRSRRRVRARPAAGSRWSLQR